MRNRIYRMIALLLPVLLLCACARGGVEPVGTESVPTAPETQTTLTAPESAVDTTLGSSEMTDTPTPSGQNTGTTSFEPPAAGAAPALYLGVADYGAEQTKKENIASFRYRFFIDGREERCAIDDAGGTYQWQNLLIEGSLYDLTVENGTVIALAPAKLSGAAAAKDGTRFYRVHTAAGGAYVTEDTPKDGDVTVLPDVGCGYLFSPTPEITPAVRPEAGVRTLVNFLRTALLPVGNALYVYGGGWDWQDEGSSVQSTTIGLPRCWTDFFYSNGADYEYKNADPAKSFYPFGAYNEYYYAGLDCSGYLGWAVYNTLHAESGGQGYVGGSTGFAQRLAELGLGSFEHHPLQDGEIDLRPGDVFSVRGHVYIVLGLCADGSVLIVHSTVDGALGSGVQLSAVGSDEGCEALKLARDYMSKYCPAWSKRYQPSLKSPGVYFDLSHEKAGRFRWSLDEAGLLDPDGAARMTPAELLALLVK